MKYLRSGCFAPLACCIRGSCPTLSPFLVMPLVQSSSEYIFSSVTLAISTQDTLSHFSASFSWELRSADFGCLLINTVIPRILIGSHIFQVNWYYRHAALVTEIAQNHVWYFFHLGTRQWVIPAFGSGLLCRTVLF